MSSVRSMCEGVVPLPGRLEPWHEELASEPNRLAEMVAAHGSPVNLIDPAPMERNAAELSDAAASRDVPLRLFFARKANKAIALVDEAKRLGLGIDVASERELRQVLDRGVSAEDAIVTAAIKPRPFIELCVESGTVVAIDNRDELRLLGEVASAAGQPARIALRLAPTLLRGVTPTRFGMTASEISALDELGSGDFAVAGVHFHLDGYDAAQRVAAIGESLGVIDHLRDSGHAVAFLDMGGGIPMSYLESAERWDDFWAEHERALAGDRTEITIDGHALGRTYPYHQAPVRGNWLGGILDSSLVAGTVADELRTRELELRMEPGRSLLDGCGMTVARVEFRKQRADGEWLIGLAMNRTQMRSTSDDYLVDPLLVRPAGGVGPTEEIEGYLVGAYCIEREFISWRRFSFPQGVAVGDLVAFPNTAGYLMHILESASHQIPLARNVVVKGGEESLDAIEQMD
jgi:diaminopimelate decarboxylase